MKKYSKGEIAKTILKGLLVGGTIAAVFVAPGTAVLLKYFDAKERGEKQRVKRALARLEKKGLIRIKKKKDGGNVIELTKKGKKAGLRYSLEDIKIPKMKKWDGKVRVIIFDVPNTKTYERKQLSITLQNAGCEYVQRSVYITPNECRDEIDFIFNQLRVGDDYLYIETDTISGSSSTLGKRIERLKSSMK